MNVETLNIVNLDDTSATYKAISNSGGGGGNCGGNNGGDSGGEDTPELDIPIMNDGKTYLYLDITSNLYKSISLNFKQSIANGVIVDWGDGSTKEMDDPYGGTCTFTHEYSSIGKYTIILEPKNGCTLLLGFDTYEGGNIFGKRESSSSAYKLLGNLVALEVGGSNTSISYKAFQYCKLLTTVILSGIREVKSSAFIYCTSLSKVLILGDSLIVGENVFGDCYSLEKVIVQNGIFGYNKMFNKCYQLSEITINSAGAAVCGNCHSLKNITFGNNITTIGEQAFDGCTSIENITIPESVTSIGRQAFINCYKLKKINISNINAWCNITHNEMYSPFPSFQNLGLYVKGKHVTDLVIPSGTTAIKSRSFSTFDIKSVTIPDSVTSIGDYAFSECEKLENITISNGVTSIGKYAFADNICQNITIPDSVTSIGARVFSGCNLLTNVDIGDGVAEIGEYAFYNLKIEGVLTLPSATTVYRCAFSGCNKLKGIIFGNSITKINNDVFNSCSEMEFCDFSQCTSVPTLGGDAFYYTNKCKIIVPDDLYDEWIASTNWSNESYRTIKKSDWEAQNS